MKNNDEFIVDNQEEVINLPDKIVDNVLEHAEKRLKNIKKIKEFALSLTSKKDWVDQGGEPYLTGSGCEKVARPFGVSLKLKDPPYEKITGSDEIGEYYLYIFYGTVSMGQGIDTMDVIGKCSSRDKFFAYKDGILKPISEIDEPNIMMKAYNNLYMNGVKRILGLRNMTWDEVKSGVNDRGDISRVQYQNKKADTDPEKDTQKKEMLANIDRLLLEQLGDDKSLIENILWKVSEYKNFPRAKNTEQMKGWTLSRVSTIYGKLKKEFEVNGKEEVNDS